MWFDLRPGEIEEEGANGGVSDASVKIIPDSSMDVGGWH
jgi:hypothetical protein